MYDRFRDRRFRDRYATEQRMKRLRRFAVSLLDDLDAADLILLEVMKTHRQILDPARCPVFELKMLLQAANQYLRSAEKKSPNISLINPLRSEQVDSFVKFQSLAFTQKAIISLLLIEQLSPNRIAKITELSLPQTNLLISQSLEFLAGGEKRQVVSGWQPV